MNCSIQWTSCPMTGWQMNMDYGWNNWPWKANVLAEQSVPMPLFSTQIQCGLSWDWTRPFTVKKRYNILLSTRKLRCTEKLHDRWHCCHVYGGTGVTAHYKSLYYSYIYTSTHTPHTYIHTYIHTYLSAYIYAYIYIHIHIHAYIHTYTHTHIHIHTYVHIYTNIHIYIYTYPNIQVRVAI